MSSMTERHEPATGSETGAGATRKLARHAATLQYDALPAAMVDLTKQCVLDTLGRDDRRQRTRAGGDASSRTTSRISAASPRARCSASAARRRRRGRVFVNGSLGHMLDYDDVGDGGHVSIVTIPVGSRDRREARRRAAGAISSPRLPPAPTSYAARRSRSTFPTGR